MSARYKNSSRENYAETFELFEKWMQSDVPLAGQIFRELTNDLSRENKLYRNLMKVGEEIVNLKNITVPLLNMIADSRRRGASECQQAAARNSWVRRQTQSAFPDRPHRRGGKQLRHSRSYGPKSAIG